MARKIGEDISDQKVIDNVSEYGWHCTGIPPEGDLPGFAFTIGLFHSYDHPEFIIFGLPWEVAHEVLHLTVQGLKGGSIRDLSLPTDELLEGYPCVFVQVPETEYHEHVGYCRCYYEGNSFPLYQIVWPSNNGIYPWNADASEAFRSAQPVLGQSGKGV